MIDPASIRRARIPSRRDLGEALRAVQRAIRSLGRDPLLATLSLGILAATLLVLGTLLVVVAQTGRIAGAIAPSNAANLYLEAPLTPQDRAALLKRVEGLPGIREARYLGPEEALDELTRDLPQWRGWIAALAENPLPATVVVTFARDHGEDAVAEAALLEGLGALAGVVEIDAPGTFTASLARFLSALRWSAVALAAALVAALLFIVVATLRLALHARGGEIEILRYAGATERWIRAPLVIEGVLIGTLAGILAWGIAALLTSQLGGVELPALVSGPTRHAPIAIVPAAARLTILVLGPLLGGTGAALAIRWSLGPT